MLVLADASMPQDALTNLEKYGEVIRFSSQGITYPAISGHPDIFFCPTPQGLVYAPNTPEQTITTLKKKGIKLIAGNTSVGLVYPASAIYNAFVNNSFFVHRTDITDPILKDKLKELTSIHTMQGYTRCNLAEVAGLYITGDHGIESALIQQGLETFFVNQSGIILPGYSHGFIGGCTGVHGNNLFICGSLDYLPEGETLKQKLTQRGVNIVSLYQGPLWDGGGILFL